MTATTPPDPGDLVPETQQWDDGKGVDIGTWFGSVAEYTHAVGYIDWLWPRFFEFDDCVLFGPWSESEREMRERNYAEWLESFDGDKAAVESMLNHRHSVDEFPAASQEPTRTQVRHIGRMLCEIWSAKLERDFPARQFAVAFNDEDDLDLVDYQITFYQTGSRRD